MTDAPIEELTATTDLGDGQFEWDVPDGWQQGRGAFGGIVMCTVVRTLKRVLDDDSMPLRTVTGMLCGPVTVGPARLVVRELRRGSNTYTATCDVIQDDEVKSHVTAFFGRRRVEDGDWNDLDPPEFPHWEEIGRAPMGPPLAPVFTQHVDIFPVAPFPFSGADERGAGGWARVRTPTALAGEEYLAFLADIYWPAFMSTQEEFRPAATVGFTMEFFESLEGLDPHEPVRYRASVPVSKGGYMFELREIWGSDGRLLGLNQQTFCIIK